MGARRARVGGRGIWVGGRSDRNDCGLAGCLAECRFRHGAPAELADAPLFLELIRIGDWEGRGELEAEHLRVLVVEGEQVALEPTRRGLAVTLSEEEARRLWRTAELLEGAHRGWREFGSGGETREGANASIVREQCTDWPRGHRDHGEAREVTTDEECARLRFATRLDEAVGGYEGEARIAHHLAYGSVWRQRHRRERQQLRDQPAAQCRQEHLFNFRDSGPT